MKSVQSVLHKVLQDIRRDVYLYDAETRRWAICRNVDDRIASLNYPDWEKVKAELKRLMQRWPEGTGSSGFPVPADPRYSIELSLGTESGAFQQWQDSMFGNRQGVFWSGTYGARRMALLDWLIRETAP